jgi:bloom syndrome protein
MRDCALFKQSFNRPNLRYEVRKKGKNAAAVEDIANLINSTYQNCAGIIYCLSRKECEDLAQELSQDHGISAHHYHAGMKSDEKEQVQESWQEGRYLVIVATIAFGMGIDKADVRFVIHHSMPKSLEGYYQETGRAGRDAERSGCYMLYNYSDASRYRKMIFKGEGDADQKARQNAMLGAVVQFCENRIDCRREQVLRYFNENFDSRLCDGGCDNCLRQPGTLRKVDMSEYANKAVQLVRGIYRQWGIDLTARRQTGAGMDKGVTMIQLLQVFNGRLKSKRPDDEAWRSLSNFGAGSGLKLEDSERLFSRLFAVDVLREVNKPNKMGFITQYIIVGFLFLWEVLTSQPGSKAGAYSGASCPKLEIDMESAPGALKAPASRKKKPQSDTTNDLSTNVSSPIRRKRGRAEPELTVGRRGYAIDSFVADESEDEYFEPVASKPFTTYRAAPRAASPVRRTGVAEISFEHQCAIDGFMIEARKWCKELSVAEKIRKQPFSDTVLHAVAVRMPATMAELLQTDGIDAAMANSYGAYLLRLVGNMKDLCGEISQADALPPSSGGMSSKPFDPNHEVFVISDDDEHVVSDSDKESRAVERSRFFAGDDGPAALDPAVANFNHMIGGTQQRRAAASRATPAPRPTSAASGYRNQSTSKAGGGSKAPYVKKKWTKGGGRRAPTGRGGGKKKDASGGSGFNAGGIGMMPT